MFLLLEPKKRAFVPLRRAALLHGGHLSAEGLLVKFPRELVAIVQQNFSPANLGVTAIPLDFCINSCVAQV